MHKRKVTRIETTTVRKPPNITQSDTTLLMTVEDVINIAMGPPDVNTVNFKMLQSVLLILARQLRMLGTTIEIRESSSELAVPDWEKRGGMGKSKGGGGSLAKRSATKSSLTKHSLTRRSPNSSSSTKSSLTEGFPGRWKSKTGRDRDKDGSYYDKEGSPAREESGRHDQRGRSKSRSGYEDDEGRRARKKSTYEDDDERRARGKSIYDDDRGERKKSTYGDDDERRARGKSISDDDRGGRKKSTYGDDDERRARGKSISDDDRGGRKKSTYGDDDERRARGKSIYDDERGGRKKSTYGDDDDERRARGKSIYDDERGGRKKSTYGDDDERRARGKSISDDDRGGRKKSTYGDDDERRARGKSISDDDRGGRKKSTYDDDDERRARGKSISDDDRGGRKKSTYGDDDERRARGKSISDDDRGGRKKSTYDDDDERRARGMSISDDDRGGRKKLTYGDDDERRARGKSIYDDERGGRKKTTYDDDDERRARGMSISDDDRGGRKKSTYGDDDERRARGKSISDDDRGGRKKSTYGDDDERRARGKSISDDDRGGRKKSTYGDDDDERRARGKSISDDDRGGRKKSTYGDDDDERRARGKSISDDDRGGRKKSTYDDDDERRARGMSIYDDDRGGRKKSTYGDDDERRARGMSIYDDDRGGRKKSTYGDDQGPGRGERGGAGGARGRDADHDESASRKQSVSASRAPSRGPSRVGSIEVVTYSQFNLLREDVDELRRTTGPIPPPTMPDNRRLRNDLAAGSATLVDTMKAMQVAARVRATEEAISRFSEMITHLAASGHLPKDIASRMPDVVKFRSKADVRNFEDEDTASAKSWPRFSTKTGAELELDAEGGSRLHAGDPSRRSSLGSKDLKTFDGVTHKEMEETLASVKAELFKNMHDVTTKARSASEGANAVANSIAEKMEMASKLNSRVSEIHDLILDYADQLDGYDTGLNIQIQGFQEQMAEMRADLKAGVAILETSQANPETIAVRELTERYEGLVNDLETTAMSHGKLQARQRHINEDLTNLMNAVEMLREQKADNEEVLDLLRDKADRKLLSGMVTEKEFLVVRGQMDSRLDACYSKFDLQQATWFTALSDLNVVADNKAELMQLMGMKDDASRELNTLKSRLDFLAEVLGEPKAAILTRQLAKDASCGVCRVPALMDVVDAAAGKPPLLPAFIPQGVELPQEEVCQRDWQIPYPKEEREHVCHRWAGGSHTVVGKNVTKQRAEVMDLGGVPTRKYEGLGADGRFYQFEEELKPCEECHKILEAQTALKVPPLELVTGAAGDQGHRRVTLVGVNDDVSINQRASHEDIQEEENRQESLMVELEPDVGVRRKTTLDENAIKRISVVETEFDVRRATILSVKSFEEDQVSSRNVIFGSDKGEGEHPDGGDAKVKGIIGQANRRVTLPPDSI